MSHIRGKDTKPEMIVRKHLHSNGLRYRLHVKGMAGRPDLVLPRYRTVVFVHGCFWHCHEGCFRLPNSRQDFWAHKLGRNVANDIRQQAELRAEGWRVLTVWECELKPAVREATLTTLVREMDGPPDIEDIAY